MSATDIITVIDADRIDQINAAHRACERSYGDALVNALECGRLLIDAKNDLAHGEWLPWLEENFEGSERTARVYMQLADSPELLNRQSTADLPSSMNAALRDLAKPRTTERASHRDATTALNALEDDEDDQQPTEPATPRTLWTEKHARARHRIIDLLDESRSQLDRASAPGLHEHAVADLLREAEVSARQASVQLGDLAFSFEQ